MRYPSTTKLPDRPDAPEWLELWEHIVHTDEQEAMDTFRWACWNSFWFFCRRCLSFGELICQDKHNEHFGKPWADHPWVYDRCMELQTDPNGKWHKWPRFYFKTTLITQSYPQWEWVRDVGPEYHEEVTGTDLTFLILTHKVDETGEGFLWLVRKEIERNEKLGAHWPDLFYPQPRQSGEWTSSSFRIRQRTNPKEPSMMVASLEAPPTNTHWRRIIFDDPVVRETVRNPEMMKKCFSAMRQATFLGHDNTETRHTGTHWAPGDPWAMGIRAGLFEVNFQDCYDENNDPVLRSREWLEEWHRAAGDYDWAAQMRGNPIALSEQRFMESWLQYYDDPLRERKGKNVHILIDPARSNKDSADYTAVIVLALGADRKYYVLDMYRERMGLEEFTDLVFRLVVDWSPICVWEEEYGAQRDIEHIKYVQEQEGFRFKIQSIPHRQGRAKDTKPEQIGQLQRAMQQRRFYFAFKYGHKPRNDNRDVMAVFYEDEYRQWTPEGGAMHDDLLDILSAPLNPKFAKKLKWPDPAGYRRLAERVRQGTEDFYRRPRKQIKKWSAWASI